MPTTSMLRTQPLPMVPRDCPIHAPLRLMQGFPLTRLPSDAKVTKVARPRPISAFCREPATCQQTPAPFPVLIVQLAGPALALAAIRVMANACGYSSECDESSTQKQNLYGPHLYSRRLRVEQSDGDGEL